MRGQLDDAIAEQQGQAVLKADDPELAARERPPGGKPLLRLMQLLERQGFEDPAATVVGLAVPDDARKVFDERLAGVSAAPNGRSARRTRRKPAKAPDAAAIAEAYAEVAQDLGPPTPTGPQWRSLGPWTIPNGQTYGASRVNVAGRVSAIAVHPTNPARVLCGAANGGVWESFDRGASWAPRTDYQATLTVGAIAYDPK